MTAPAPAEAGATARANAADRDSMGAGVSGHKAGLAHVLSVAAAASFVLYAAMLPVAMAPMTVAGGVCVGLALAAGISSRRAPWVRTPLERPSLVWLAAMVLATLFAADRGASAAGLGKGVIPLVAGFTAWQAVERRNGVRAIAALLAAGSAAALIATARFVAAGGRFPARAIGLSGSWMTFGMQMLLLVSLATAVALTARGWGWRIGALAAALAGTIGLAASFTRSAWLGLVASLALVLGLRSPRALLGLAAVLVVAFVAPGDFGDRLRSAFDPAHPMNRERALMWDSGTLILRDHPLTGVGLIDLRPELARYRSPEAVERPRHLHDSYLQVSATTGLIGLAAFLALCLGLVRTSAGGLLAMRRDRGLAVGVRLGVTAGTAGFLVAALFDHTFGDEQLLFLLFSLAGIAWAARGWGETDEASGGAGHGA